MEQRNKNPLFGYFRQPSIYLNLPSKGQWWDEGSLSMPETGELAIYPMTTRDEVTLRTPDALLNGQGVVDVIQSCCPEIKDAWKMPSVDVDAVLIAIRIASYGNEMNFESKCGHCNESNTHAVDLGESLGSLHCPDYEPLLPYKTLKIKIKPQQYFSANQSNMINFEEEKMRNTIAMTDLDPADKASRLADSMKRLVELAAEICAASTEYIELSSGVRVTNKDYLAEFYKEAESAVTAALQAKLAEFNKDIKMKPLTLTCFECKKSYLMELTFDYSNFFAKGF